MIDPIMAARLAELRQQELLQTASRTREAGWSLTNLMRPLTHVLHALTAGQPHLSARNRKLRATHEMREVAGI